MLARVPTSDLSTIRGLLIDLDGVVYTGGAAIPGGADFIAAARRHGLPFLLVTNNSTTSPAKVAERLAGMGIHVEPTEILTSSDAAAAYAVASGPKDARALVVGEAGLREALAAAGLQVVDDGEAVDWVVAGLDRSFDYAKLTAATLAMRGGARLLATNVDALLPVEGGAVLPGAGSIVAAIATATGVQPTIAGKPSPALFQRGLQRLGNLAPGDAAMVGDRIDTDILGAQAAGLRTILVLSGVSTAEEAAALDPPADAVLDRLASLADAFGW